MQAAMNNRRSFLIGSVAGISTAAIATRSWAAANDEVRVGRLGAGWRGGQLAAAFSKPADAGLSPSQIPIKRLATNKHPSTPRLPIPISARCSMIRTSTRWSSQRASTGIAEMIAKNI